MATAKSTPTPPKSDPVDFRACVRIAYENKELVREFDRLHGTNLMRRGIPIELEIDRATGKHDADLLAFIEFVDDCIWQRLPPEAFEP